MVALRVVVCLTVLATAAFATNVQQCPARSIENLNENVQLSPCKKPPCRLKKGTNQSITINFTPDKDMENIKNRVTAKIYGVDLPFLGVDGISICDKIFLENDEKAPCPLKAGTKYFYKDHFPILAVYPTLNANVHWELQDAKDDNDIICFEVPVRIT